MYLEGLTFIIRTGLPILVELIDLVNSYNFSISNDLIQMVAKVKLFAEHFFKNSSLDYSGIFLPVFPSGTNLKLHNISVTPKMVKQVITNLDF